MKEEGIPMIEHYLYEEHERLRQAAMECMCNMVLNEEVRRYLFFSSFFEFYLLLYFLGQN